jgi:hypothetical protein
MAHEKSATVKKGTRWFNIDTVGKDKGRILGSQKGFQTMKKAVQAAEARSPRFGTVHSPRDKGKILRKGKAPRKK